MFFIRIVGITLIQADSKYTIKRIATNSYLSTFLLRYMLPYFIDCGCNKKNTLALICNKEGKCTKCKKRYKNGVDKCNTCDVGYYKNNMKCYGEPTKTYNFICTGIEMLKSHISLD